MHRYASSIVSLKWTSDPELVEVLSGSWPEIDFDDFKDDCSFSWYISAELKEYLASFFLASVALHTHMGSLGRILLKNTVREMQTTKVVQPTTDSSDLWSVVEVEHRLAEWQKEFSEILTRQPPASLSSADVAVFLIEQFIIRGAHQ
jgi:hypothetical protein